MTERQEQGHREGRMEEDLNSDRWGETEEQESTDMDRNTDRDHSRDKNQDRETYQDRGREAGTVRDGQGQRKRDRDRDKNRRT